MSIDSFSSAVSFFKLGAASLFLASVLFFAFAGVRYHMPARSPVVLNPNKIIVYPNGYNVMSPERREDTAHGLRPLKVVSYNVHECLGTDARRDPDRVAAVIRSLDADIVSLQEVLSDRDGVPSSQLRDIAGKAGMYMAVAGPTMEKGDRRFGNALMSRFPITNVRLHDISFGRFEPRGIIDADVQVGDVSVRVVSTHFGLWPMERERQARRLLEILPADPGRPLVVMGDMNGWIPGSLVMRRLRERLGSPASVRSFPSWFPLLPLDRIWILPGKYRFEVAAPQSPLARMASDHLPMLCSVFLRETESNR